MPPDLRRFVEDSLAVLSREAPVSYSTLCATLAGRRVCISCDGDVFALCFGSAAVSTVAARPSDGVHLTVDRPTIFALVDGEFTFEEALREDRLDVRGEVTAVADLFDGLLVYLRGAVRCPSLPPLLADFRGARPGSCHEALP